MATSKEQREVEIVINGTKANASLSEMEKALRVLNTQFKELPKGTKEWKDKMAEVAKQRQGIDEIRNAVKGVSNEMTLAQKVTTGLGSVFASVFGALTLTRAIGEVVSFVQEGIRLKAVYSDAFSDIQKSTGMTADEVAKLNEKLGEVDTRTGQLDLLDIAKVGGQIGIAKDEIEGFTIAVDKAVVALGDEFSGGAEEVAGKMGTLKTLFKETKDLDAGTAINQIGSAINELGAAGSATGPVMAEFAARIGQLGDLAPQIDQTLGLGAAMQELGLSAEVSAGGLTNIFLQAGKESAAFARQIGMTQDQFKQLLNTNPNEMLLKLAESMKGMSNTNIIATMDNLKLGTQESIKVMSLLANQTDKVREKQLLASTAMKEATSLTNEFNIKNNNEAAQLAKTQKEWEKMKVTIGDQFMPLVGDGMRVIMPLLKGLTSGFITFINIIRAIPSFVSENKELFIGLGIALVSLNAANIAASASALYHVAVEKGRAIATKSTAAAQWLLNAAMSANPIGLVIAAVALLVTGFITLYKNSETVRGAIAGLGDAAKKIFTNIVEAAVKTLGGLGDFLVGVFTMDVDKIKNGLKNAFTGVVELHTGFGKGVADAYNKGYDEKMASEHANQKGKATQRAKEVAAANKTGLDQQVKDTGAAENDKTMLTIKEQKARDKAAKAAAREQKKDDKEAAAEAKKAAEDRLKAEEEISKRKIGLITDEYEQKRAKISAEADKEIANLVGTEDQKKQLIKMIRQQQWNELDALEAANEEKKTEAAIEAENRRQVALAELKLIQAEESGSPEDVLEAQLEQMDLEREMKLADHRLTKEEMDLINAEFDQKERSATDALAQYKKEKLADGLNTGLNMASQLAGAINSLQKAETDKKLSDAEKVKSEKIKKLDEELAAGLISKDAYDAAKLAAEQEYTKKTDKLKAEQQKRNKRAAIIQALISTAMAVVSALASPTWPAAIGFAAFAALMGGLQVAAIAKQPDASFAKGGYTAPTRRKNNGFVNWSDVIDHFAVGGYTGGSQAPKATFAHGGWIDRPMIGQIGEAGTEWVMPNWMIESPKYANIVGYLESERRVNKRFADGGPTTGSIPSVAAAADTGGTASETSSKFDTLIMSVEGLRSDMNSWQREIRAVYDISVIDDELRDLYKLRAQGTIS
jgi:TP901 family phage tail tape measure protein